MHYRAAGTILVGIDAWVEWNNAAGIMPQFFSYDPACVYVYCGFQSHDTVVVVVAA